MSFTSRDNLYVSSTPDEVKNAKGLHLITMNTPNGQATQIMLEELKLKYGTDWTTQVINISTNVQKEECMSFLRRSSHPCHFFALLPFPSLHIRPLSV